MMLFCQLFRSAALVPLFLIITAFGCWPVSEAFVSLGTSMQHPSQIIRALPTPEESTKLLQEYMAKAHEAKIQAVAQEAAKYKARIEELEAQVAAYENGWTQESTIIATTPKQIYPTRSPIAQLTATPPLASQITRPNEKEIKSYECTAINKELGQRISAYQKFISDYIVQSQIEKTKAVADAEKRMRRYYEQ